MNNKKLLRPFDLAQAEAGAAICWSHLDEPIAFVGRCSNNDIAVRRDDGIIETPTSFSLRMKPLFWKDGQPVYAGDKLWHTIAKKWIVVTKLQGRPDSEKEGYFVDDYGLNAAATLCTFDAQPVPLFQLDGKDVFTGDKLWNILYRDWMTVECMQVNAPESDASYFIATDGRNGCSKYCSWEDLSAPLFTLDGQPVYKGTRLWHKFSNKWVTVTGMYPSGDFIDEAGGGRSPYYCTWEKPKATFVRYANVYANLPNGTSRYLGELYSTPDGPKDVFGSEKSLGIARIEWEE